MTTEIAGVAAAMMTDIAAGSAAARGIRGGSAQTPGSGAASAAGAGVRRSAAGAAARTGASPAAGAELSQELG